MVYHWKGWRPSSIWASSCRQTYPGLIILILYVQEPKGYRVYNRGNIFYHHSDSEAIRQLYISLVRPHLEYGCTVWDPHTHKNKEALEKIQKFACRMATKRWDAGYDELLDLLNLPSLVYRRTHLKLCQLYKIIHCLCYFPDYIFTYRTNSTCRNVNSMSLLHPFAHTNAYYYSFVSHTITLWNSLSTNQVTSVSLYSFKRQI